MSKPIKTKNISARVVEALDSIDSLGSLSPGLSLAKTDEKLAPTPTPTTQLWYDTRERDLSASSVASRVSRFGFTGVIVYPDNVANALAHVGPRTSLIVHLASEEEASSFFSESLSKDSRIIIASSSTAILDSAKSKGLVTCLRAFIVDAASLHGSIELGQRYSYLALRFRDPTNIPLELVIASLQKSATILIKEINNPDDIDDAIVTLGVMECGAEGVSFSPREHSHLDSFLSRLEARRAAHLVLTPAKVTRSVPVGMGYRSCIDLATLFSPKEGLIVGSTSQGGILCCPEVFHLPYMELRPFRVNAGAVHSYVYNFADRTDYMSELRAGSGAMIVDHDGVTRRATVGRMKTEVRPLRLIEAAFPGGETVNVLLQDDWHVRVYSSAGEPLNVTELKPGDELLAHLARPGRHVGIKVDETILEN